MPRKVTPHFTVEEFACKNGTPYPDEWIAQRLWLLCQVLETIRADLGVPVRVLSGYRPEVYNRVVGGAKQSQHIAGRAADIVAPPFTPRQVRERIVRLLAAGKLPVLGGLGIYRSFVHVDVRLRPASGRIAQWQGRRVSAERGA